MVVTVFRKVIDKFSSLSRSPHQSCLAETALMMVTKYIFMEKYRK